MHNIVPSIRAFSFNFSSSFYEFSIRTNNPSIVFHFKSSPPYLVKCFFLKNQGFFIVYSQMNEPRKWIFLSIGYKNSGIRVYEVKRLCFSFYMALCMPFPLRRHTSRVYQDHLTFPEGPNFLRSACP